MTQEEAAVELYTSLRHDPFSILDESRRGMYPHDLLPDTEMWDYWMNLVARVQFDDVR
jgi:hypothetical protein